MSIESVLFVDLTMDALAFTAVSLGLGRLHPLRILFALACSQVNTLLFTLCGGSVPGGWPVRVLSFLLTSAVLSGTLSPRRVLLSALCLACAMATAAGFARLFSSRSFPLPAAAAGMLLFARVLYVRRNIHRCWNIQVYVEKGGRRISFPALIDTGNRLCEARSGQPVMIVEAALLAPLKEALSGDPDIRTVAFGVLGGSGTLRCFRPDRTLLINASGETASAPPVWIAAFPGSIPGGTCALAPPEFAFLRFGESISLLHILSNTTRRFHHAFQHRSSIHLWSRRPDPQGRGLLHRRQRSASAAADTGGGNCADSKDERRGQAFPRNAD